MRLSKLKRAVNKTSLVPALPRTVFSITELINDPDSSASDFADVIYADPTLTGRLLGLANSCFQEFSLKVYTVSEAVGLLGFDTIRDVLLDIPLTNPFIAAEKHKIKVKNILDHSLCCAVGAEVIGKHIGYETEVNLFVLGLLHDIGKIVEILYFPEDFLKSVSLAKEKNILMLEAEKRVMNVTHPEIGTLLAEKWELPPAILNAITHHHQSHLAGAFALETSIVHLADILCRTLDMESHDSNVIPPQNLAAWKLLQLEPGSIKEIAKEIEKEFNEIKASLRSISVAKKIKAHATSP